MRNIFQILLTVALSLLCGFTLVAVIPPDVAEQLPTFAVSPFAISAVICFSTFFAQEQRKKGSNVAYMAVSVEIWVKYIMDSIFKDNSFLELCAKDDEFVVQGSVVHIPQAGAKPTIVKNRSSFPATAVRRTDGDITYALDVYTSDPTHIPKAELMEISYPKIDSVLGDHMNTLRDVIGDAMLYKWRAEAAANILRTTGGAVAAHLGSATGNRKIFLKEDLKRAQTRLNKLGISKSDRYALMDSEMLSQLQDDADLKKRDVGMELDMKNGVIMKLYGFQIIERMSGLIYDNTGTPVAKDYDAAAAATDNASVLCWQKDAVARALGTVDFFEDLRNPLYYGDVYSALVKFGGRKRRTNAEGVVAIVQDASA